MLPVCLECMLKLVHSPGSVNRKSKKVSQIETQMTIPANQRTEGRKEGKWGVVGVVALAMRSMNLLAELSKEL